MTVKTNKEKAEQLGMPSGTASARLKNQLFFSLLEKLNENICLKCGQIIETPDELSIDHIKPWFRVSNELFWDHKNIKYSHRKCNRPDNPKCRPRKIGPTGTAWCSGKCKAFLPVSNFGTDTKRWNGLQSSCKKCKQQYK